MYENKLKGRLATNKILEERYGSDWRSIIGKIANKARYNKK